MVLSLVRKHRQLLAVLLLAVVVAALMAANRGSAQSGGTPAESGWSSAPVSAPAPSQESAGAAEMRGVWVSYMDLDESGSPNRSEETFRARFDAIVQNAKAAGMNTLIVHVRPFSDAMYPSNLYPWSHLVGGTQGQDPGFDPLAYMVAATHAAGLSFQAWVNPLRVQLNGLPPSLSDLNPWNVFRADEKRRSWAVEYGGNKYLDPGFSGVRDYITAGVREIVEHYDVDGVQFDDYFYPTEDAAFDAASYAEYQKNAGGDALPLDEWRCENINALLKSVYAAIKAANPAVQFGVSPQGNLTNDYKMGADVAVWVQNPGYLDYICPQLYYNYDNPTLPFASAVQTWRDLVTQPQVRLYFGLALYKANTNADSGSWLSGTDTLARQVKTGREAGCDGFLIYAYPDLLDETKRAEIENLKAALSEG